MTERDGRGEAGRRPEKQEAVPAAVAEAPDGGWGWVVLLATIVVLALTLAFPSCVGIFYTDLQNDFHASNSETSWVPSIMTSVLHAGGRGSLSVLRYGPRVVFCVNDFLFSFRRDTAQRLLLLLFYDAALKPNHRAWLAV